jgi:hypothetical protein
MKKIALVYVALAMLAGAPAVAQVSQHRQQSWTSQHVNPGYYDPSKVRRGDVPFAPF